QPDDVQVERRGDDELGTGQQHGAGRLRIEDGAGAKEHTVAEGVPHAPQHIQGVWHGHGDFHYRHAAVNEGADHLNALLAIGRTDDSDEAAVEDMLKVASRHWQSALDNRWIFGQPPADPMASDPAGQARAIRGYRWPELLLWLQWRRLHAGGFADG